MLAMLALVTTALAHGPAAEATPISSLPDRAAPVPVAAAEVPAPPPAVAAVRPMLGARHTKDLPSRELLDAKGDAAAALRWIAAYGDTLVEAERAAVLLAVYDDEETGRFCTALLDGDAHPKIRAGAATCLIGRPIDQIEATGPLLKAAASSDVRVGMAAVDALRGSPEGKQQLKALPAESLLEPVRARVAALD